MKWREVLADSFWAYVWCQKVCCVEWDVADYFANTRTVVIKKSESLVLFLGGSEKCCNRW